MSATHDLKACLFSLCQIIENGSSVPKGLISPELFRLAKQDDEESLKPMSLLCYHLLTDTFGDREHGLKKNYLNELNVYLDKLNISRPKSKIPKALLSIFSILLHRLNFIDVIFYQAIDITKMMQSVAAEDLTTSRRRISSVNSHEQVLIIGKIRQMVAALKHWRSPKLPESVDYLSFEEFIIAQSDDKLKLLDQEITSRLSVIKNYAIWNEKEDYFWEWVQQNFDSDLFLPIQNSETDLNIHPEAKAQITRIEKMLSVFAKLPKPKFRPDRLKAETQLTQALLGNMTEASNLPPAGLARMQQQKESLLQTNISKLTDLVKEEKTAFVTFP